MRPDIIAGPIARRRKSENVPGAHGSWEPDRPRRPAPAPVPQTASVIAMTATRSIDLFMGTSKSSRLSSHGERLRTADHNARDESLLRLWDSLRPLPFSDRRLSDGRPDSAQIIADDFDEPLTRHVELPGADVRAEQVVVFVMDVDRTGKAPGS